MSERPTTDWTFIRRNAWRWKGGDRWSRDWTPLMTFVAQSNASGPPRVLGLLLTLAGDAVFERLASPLLHRGMKGPRLGIGAHPLSITWLAWRASGVANGFRWWLYGHANRLARYNS